MLNGGPAIVSFAEDMNEDYRSHMEDGHAVVSPLLQQGKESSDQWGFYAVYDGHGGSDEMKYCEANLHKAVAVELRKLRSMDRSSVRGAFTAAFRKVDGDLEKLGSSNSGCTATAAIARRLPEGGVELHVANVGDSRALLVGAFGNRRLTVDHRTDDASELERVKSEGGFVLHRRVGGVLSVTRALGDHFLKPGVSCDPDVSTYGGGAPDETVALVIASDGLWDTLQDDEVNEIIAECQAAAFCAAEAGTWITAESQLQERAAKALVERAKAKGSKDNILALVVFF